MPDLGESSNCAEKIFVPPALPSILKGYCKAAIRTQPYDLLRWSAAYFRSLANDELPLSKERLEFPPKPTIPGLTPGYLKALINQFGKDVTLLVQTESVSAKWNDFCLPPNQLDLLVELLEPEEFRWLHFVAVAAGSISPSLTQTMILLCELLTYDPLGGRAAVPVELFLELYEFLANLDVSPEYFESAFEEQKGEAEISDAESSLKGESCTNLGYTMYGEDDSVLYDFNKKKKTRKHKQGIGRQLPPEMVDAVKTFMETCAMNQGGLVMPRNIRHWMCPPLDESAYKYTI